MIFSEESIKPQIAQLLQKYPNFTVVQSDSQIVRLCGQILVHRVFNDFTLRKTYNLEINIPIGSDELPFVIDTDRQINQSYRHYYPSGKLCLATDSQMRIHFIDGFELAAWVSEFVEPYFFSYEYSERFGNYPFGERAHGTWGIIQTYQDLLKSKDLVEAYKLMRFIKEQEYRGHHLCPCESGKKLRNCHGQAMLDFYRDPRIKKIMIADLNKFDKELKTEYERKRNRKEAK